MMDIITIIFRSSLFRDTSSWTPSMLKTFPPSHLLPVPPLPVPPLPSPLLINTYSHLLLNIYFQLLPFPVPFSYFAASSGVSIYESWVYTGFNFILGLPIIFYGIQDRDISAAFAMANPEVTFDSLVFNVR